MRDDIISWVVSILVTSTLAAHWMACASGYTHGRAHEGSPERFGGIPIWVSDPAPRFTFKKVGSRWVFVTPDGNAFWMKAVYNVNVSGSVDHRGITYSKAVVAKYGDANVTWGPQQNRRLQGWGFNATAEYSSAYVQPTTTSPSWPGKLHPAPMPFVGLIWPSYYALRNYRNHADGPVKDLVRPVKRSVYAGWRAHSPDVWDPNYRMWLEGAIKNDYNIRLWLDGPNGEFLAGLNVDDVDWLQGFGAGADFKTVANGVASVGREQPHLAWVILLTPPVQAGSAEFNLAYPDTTCHAKRELASFLAARYGDINSLNTAWGSQYSTFGSTATSVRDEVVGRGDGAALAFSTTLRNYPVSPHSLSVKVGGKVVAGDSGDGIMRSSTGVEGRLAYESGQLSLAFKEAPAERTDITADYETSGWGKGSGLLDEDGTHSWVAKDYKGLADGAAAFQRDLDGFLFHHARKYFSDIRDVLSNLVPGVLYLGPTTLGSWGAPPRRQILQAARDYVDAIGLYTIPAGVPDDQARIDFVAEHGGDKPWISWEGMMAAPDSYFHEFRAPDSVSPQSSTQQMRGNLYARRLDLLWNMRTDGGVNPIVGLKFWELADNSGERANWGLVTRLDNAYDGIEACASRGRDSAGFEVGGEEKDYGDFITSVRDANRSVDIRLREELEGRIGRSARAFPALRPRGWSAPQPQ